MKDELDATGLPVTFVTVNQAASASSQTTLSGSCSFPVFQDTFEMDAWGMHGGKKDDIYIYDVDGVLIHHFSNGGPININLSTSDGYENIKNAVLEALQ